MSEPLTVKDTGQGWRFDWPDGRRRYVYRSAPISSVGIRAKMAKGMDTLDIANELGTTEAFIWNALALAGQ